jgi:hypothetical protein
MRVSIDDGVLNAASQSMILILMILWVLFSVIFFCSLAVAASLPIPPLNCQPLMNDATLNMYHEVSETESEYAYAGTSNTDHKLETVAG